jgi:lipopolysaccharide transport system ATP-binding protein
MSDVVIKVENLSKLYRLGVVGTGTLSHDINRLWAKVRGKEDPYIRIGEKNTRTQKGDSDYVWALKDINFEVRRGEVLGIVGRNGAGKSTLLKILSQITRPTTGSVKMKGRVGALLEVGTGFHSDLTGRENIFINGAILGMRKREISKKLDEIIAFAGVERYIDTPVKRYSSGMKVRLGFSVAAHLEPEILVVDEVLAVGDIEFQKKCLGKMSEVSRNDGRTILFVSHNLNSMTQLCQTGMLMSGGEVFRTGTVSDVVSAYLTSNAATNFDLDAIERRGQQCVILKKVRSCKENYEIFEDISLDVKLEIKSPIKMCSIGFGILNSMMEPVFIVYSHELDQSYNFPMVQETSIRITLSSVSLPVGTYFVKMRIEASGIEQDWPQEPVATFDVLNSDLRKNYKDEFTNRLVMKTKFENVKQ